MAFNEQDDPFAGVEFTSAAPSVNADDLSLVLKSFGNQGSILVNNVSGPSAVKLNVDAVNKNTAETGVVGFRDAKGQANFTNVARDPSTNKDVKLGNSAVPAGEPSEMGGQPAPINTPNGINSILTSLGKAQDAGEARGLFSSFQEAAAKEQVRLQADALTHSQNKLGVPSLEKKLAEAERADQADPLYAPGMGDSPITKGIRHELNLARGYADTEAKRLLENNLSYKLLAKNVIQAEKEMQRVQAIKDRKDTLDGNRILQNDEWKRRKEYQEEQEAEAITSVQQARIQLLSAQDFVNETQPRVKAYKILKNHKSKDFQAAVGAEGNDLAILAVKGNAYAQQLVLTEESAKTGIPQAQIKAQMDAMQKAIDNPKFMETVLKDRYGNDKTAIAKELGVFQASMLDPAKKNEVTDQKARMAFEWVARKKTQTYINDTSSWDSIDPAFRAAQAKALQTTGKQTLEDTLVAYLGDSTGPERLQKAADFEGIAKTAAQRHTGSMFGMPDYREASKIIAGKVVEEGIFKKWLAQIGKADMNAGAPRPMVAGAMVGLVGGSIVGNLPGAAVGGVLGAGYGAGVELYNNVMDGTSKPPINPATGKPFGE